MVATTRFQTTAALNFGSAKKAVPAQGVPLQQPLGYSRPQTATFATRYGVSCCFTPVFHLLECFWLVELDLAAQQACSKKLTRSLHSIWQVRLILFDVYSSFVPSQSSVSKIRQSVQHCSEGPAKTMLVKFLPLHHLVYFAVELWLTEAT